MQKRIENIALLTFSIILFTGMLFALYTDLDFFFTRKATTATILLIKNSNKFNSFSTLHIAYYNDYLKRNVKSTISLKLHDATQLVQKETTQISILYTKNYPYTVYIENVNAPRWEILIFEVGVILLMFFLFYSSLKHLRLIGNR